MKLSNSQKSNKLINLEKIDKPIISPYGNYS